MRGDIVFRVYGVHAGRDQDTYFGARRSRAKAEQRIAELHAQEMHGRNWAAAYHDQGFVVREHVVETDFEVPSLPRPRDSYVVETTSVPDAGGGWDSTRVEVRRRRGAELEAVGEYLRNYSMLQTFEPFRQGSRQLALISRDYTKTAVMDLVSGNIIAEETESVPGGGFCPIGFYVPDWWDVNDGSVLPGCEYWNRDKEWPTGEFGFVWGCYWGDDSSWKVQYLDLRRVQEGIIARDDRFGYVELAIDNYRSPCLMPTAEAATPSPRPDFISLYRDHGAATVRFAIRLDFDLASGRVDEEQRSRLVRTYDPVL